MNARNFLTKEEKAGLLRAIEEAELATSGEIRVHIDAECPADPKEKALRTFHTLNMSATAARNAVLIYVAVSSKKIAVIGDKGIDAVVPHGFWADVCETLSVHFKREAYSEGLEKAVHMVGEKLKAYFPYRDDDANELPDELSFDEDE